jgi:hypothetical protein
MSDRDKIEKAHYVQRLFEKMLAKVDHKKDHKGRHKDAESLMDEKVGKGWRKAAKPMEGVTMVEVGFVAPEEKLNHEKLVEVGDEEGLGTAQAEELPEEWDENDPEERECRKRKVLQMLKELL